MGSTLSESSFASYNLGRHESATASFCFAPSANMLFAQDGSVRVCCHNLEYVIGKYPEQSIAEIWNGDKARELRNTLKSYDLSKGCQVCRNDVDRGGYEEIPSRHFDSLPQNKAYPVMMEFLLSNTCNLECVMCQGDFSSLIRKNREKLPPISSPYDKIFLTQLRPWLLQLSEARFSGSGEAFAIDLYYEIWEILIRENPRCKIMIQTNGTYLNARIKDLLDRGNFQIGVSLDSLLKEKFELIRQNASFERVMENIEYFSQYSARRTKKFLIAACVMRNNWNELPDFVEFCTARNAEVLFHQVHSPEHLALPTLNAGELKAIYDKLKSYSFKISGKLAEKNIRHFNYFTQIIGSWAAGAANRPEAGNRAMELSEYVSVLQQALTKIKDKFSEADLVLFLAKFDKIVASFEDEEQKKLLYERALNLKTEMLVASILKYPEEYLLSEAGNFFKI